MRLAPVAFQPLGTGADRQLPVGPHLNIAVQRLHRLIIECMARGLRTCRPNQRLMRVGETAAAEIRHRIGLAPDNIVQDPEIKILENAAKTIDIVIAADHPQRPVRLQDAARFGKPGRREAVIGGEGVEFVPFILDAIDRRLVGAGQVAAKLQIIGRIGKNQIHRCARKSLQNLQAIAFDHLVLVYACHPFFSFFQRVAHTTKRTKTLQVNRWCAAFSTSTTYGVMAPEGLFI